MKGSDEVSGAKTLGNSLLIALFLLMAFMMSTKFQQVNMSTLTLVSYIVRTKPNLT
jgi:hypothetical protein